LHLPLLFNPQPESVLIVGGGGGVVPTIFRRDYPEVEIDVVELDPQVVAVADRYFGFEPDGERTRTIVQDGRIYIRDCTRQYDIILLDAFTGGRPPFHLLTREFLELVKARLTPRGVAQINIIAALNHESDKGRLYRSMHNTFRAVFGPDHVYVFPKWYDPRWPGLRGENRTSGINIELLATNYRTIPNPLPKDQIVARARRLHRDGRIKIASIPTHALNYQPAERDQPFPHDTILTDDYAPVDVMVTD
ncbi:MAG: spermidine synthase, partial [Planctomycetota bacterium]